MQAEARHDNIRPSEWIDFEHELRRRHLSSDEFMLSANAPAIAAGAARPSRDLVMVRHRSGIVLEYDSTTWKSDLIRDVSAGAFGSGACAASRSTVHRAA